MSTVMMRNEVPEHITVNNGVVVAAVILNIMKTLII